MKPIRLIACVLLPAILVGCEPEKIVWSPDGSRAVVFANQHVYLCDPNGVLTDGGAMKIPQAFAWFANSRRIAFSTETTTRDWSEVESVLSDQDKAWLTESAEAFRADILANYRDDLKALKSAQGRTVQQLQLMKMYLRDRHPEGLAERIGPKWQEFVNASWDNIALTTADVTDNGIQTNRVIVRSMDQIVCIRLNNQSKTIAYTLKRPPVGLEGPQSLCVAASDGSEAPRQAATNTGWYFDWTPDGTILIYATNGDVASSPSPRVKLGTISRRKVCGTDGSLLKHFSEDNELAAIFFSPLMQIRCLRDGRIFFSSVEGSLPATAMDMPTKESLFALDPARQDTVTRVFPSQVQAALPNELTLFSVSPDQTCVCAPGIDEGEVSIVGLRDAEVQYLVRARDTQTTTATSSPSSAPGFGIKLAVVPTWRTGHELCLMVPPGSPYGSPNRPEIILYSASDKFRCISKTWPDSLIENLSNP